MKEGKILAFGELLWRLASADNSLQFADNTLQMYPGGAEANVAASLGQWQLPCAYLTSAPENELATKALQTLQACGIDTGPVLKQGDRMGLYFLLSANGLSTGQVVYDRKYSSFSQLTPNTIDWEALLQHYSWFHWSAISPALNENVAAVCQEALVAASKLGLTISVDLNYRNKLWNYGKTPLEVMPELVQYCDVVMGNIWAANTMLGTSLATGLNRETSQEEYLTQAEQTAKEIQATYPQCKHIAFTFRFMDSPKHNLLYGTYHQGDKHYTSAMYETFELVDRIGSGDAFMAGLIYSLYQQLDGQAIVDFATAAAFQKLFVSGDFGKNTIQQIQENITSAKTS
ncbi:2-dehydro-3-deoxygluconokinase [Pontibacter ummariensis]|uniref:2-dehydro-3-deoxygluconokinase n=1 Tax=Pontibacter ummariensis TaxID=1610492 RepID=A0A239DLX9_9BACT|nr:sugar kinase [Pontibacter ummariensis]PRY13870.1 2-dehydro-3-deoxygluconokinase [Pontibacter ummariensis]SNS33159.1 2-dehydro-3-deoxygluconokinase [Pontibacter ummariensis]